MTESEDLRAAKVLTRARKLFGEENPGEEWPTASDLSHNDQVIRVQALYLKQAEKELLAEGKIESVDQS